MMDHRHSARDARRHRLEYGIRLLVAGVIAASLVGTALYIAFFVVFSTTSVLTVITLSILLADLGPVSIVALGGAGCLLAGLTVGVYHAARVAAAPDLQFQPDVIAAEVATSVARGRRRVGTAGIAFGIVGLVLLAAIVRWLGQTGALEPDSDIVLVGPLLLSVLAVGVYCWRSIAPELCGTPAVWHALSASIVRADDSVTDTDSSIDGTDEPSDPRLVDVRQRVDRLARTADLPTPEVAIAVTDRPLTLTVGLRPADSTIVVSRGLLEALDDRELEAVLAHELAHIEHRDAAVRSALAVPAANVESFVDRHEGLVTVFGTLPMLVHGLFQWPLALVARHREPVADRHAVALTRDPHSLASALETLERSLEQRSTDESLPRTAAAFSIVPSRQPERRFFAHPRRLVARTLFGTHPPTDKRIERLRTRV